MKLGRMTGLALALLGAAFILAAVPAQADPSPHPGFVLEKPTLSDKAPPSVIASVGLAAAGAVGFVVPTVRAKFKVNSITRSEASRQKLDEHGQPMKDEHGRPIYEPTEMRTICMTPVYGNGDPNHENTKFWNASPSGELKLGCVNLEAAQRFELGKEYYLDFTPVDG